MHSRQKRNMVTDKPCMSSKSKFNHEMGISMAKTNYGSERQYSAKGKEVGSSQDQEELILWHGEIGGSPSTSGCSRYQGKQIEMPSPSVKVHDSLPRGYVPLMQLQSLKESATGKECGSKITHTPTDSSKPQTNKYRASDKKEARLCVDNVTGDGRRQTGIQDGVPDKNQQSHSGNSRAFKGQTTKSGQKHDSERTTGEDPLKLTAEIRGGKMEQHGYRMVFHVSKQRNSFTATERTVSSQWKAYDRHKVNDGIVDHKWKCGVKTSPEALRMISNAVHTGHRSECLPLEGTSALKGITERSNQGRERFENAKEVGDCGTGRHNFRVRGANDEGEVDLKNVMSRDGVYNGLGDGGDSISRPFCPSSSENIQDSLPPGYVPLKQLQSSKESESRKERGSKIYISKQYPQPHTIFKKSLRDKDGAPDKNEQRQSGDMGIGDEALDKSDVTQTGGSGIEDGNPDKNRQRESWNAGASKGQIGKSGKNIETPKTNGKINVERTSHGNVEVSGMKLEQHDNRKAHEASKQWNQNKGKGPLLKGVSAVMRNQNTHSFENAKEIGGNRNGRHGFLGNGTDVEEEVNLKHAQHQYEVSEELKEGVASASYPVCPDQSTKIQDYLHPRYVPLEKLWSSKESETSKDYISKHHRETVFGMPQRNKDNVLNKNEHEQSGDTGIRDGAVGKNEMRQTGILRQKARAPDEHKQRQSGNLGASKGQKGKIGKLYETVMMNENINAKGPLHGSVEMSNRKLEQHSDINEVEDSKKCNQHVHKGHLLKWIPKGPLLKGASTSKGTTARPSRDRDCFAIRKDIGGNGIGRNGFHGSGVDVEREANLKHAEIQILEYEELREEGVFVSHPSSPNLNVEIQDSLASRYVALKQLKSSKESKTKKEY
ncbi:hypothetical protein KI387_008185 [Taxus chinensis]|uniref:Uncharacterized protein n=1 Tax=Taxus chinensis TaxID=29808 RepID=A0AA38CPY1_TAXCH|nr:hypothetical protein KI387_008185 [Taxus chinensis]